MTKYEWTVKQVTEAISEFPPGTTEYLDRFLEAIKAEGESLTRARFFEILDENEPKGSRDYFEYDVLGDTFRLATDFSEVWNVRSSPPIPEIHLSAEVQGEELPKDFAKLGGNSEWIQNEYVPICPSCDSDMVLFIQLKSVPYEFTKDNEELEPFVFGDAGNFYVFTCSDCQEYKTVSQCY